MGDEDLENSGSVLKLIDSLVTRIVGEHALSEGRSLAFEILLGKSRERRQQQKPIEECWICSVKLVELFKVSADHKDMLLLLDRLAYSVPHTHHQFLFAFGKLDDILPLPLISDNNSPQPYHHYPPQIFELNSATKDNFHTGNKYSLDLNIFESGPGKCLKNLQFWSLGDKSSPTRSINATPYSSMGFFVSDQLNRRLTEPRDLILPKENDEICNNDQSLETGVQNETHLNSAIMLPKSIWDYTFYNNIPVDLDLWSEASKLPYFEKRNLISASTNQMSLWKKTHINKIDKLCVISETEFILHIKYLIIGIQSHSFTFDHLTQKFVMRKNLCLEGVNRTSLKCYIGSLLFLGTCYWKLNNMVSSTFSMSNIEKGGFVYQTICNNLRNYLVWYRLEIDKIFGEELFTYGQKDIAIPGLLSILRDLKTLSKQVETMSKIFIIDKTDQEEKTFYRGYFMAHLYNEIINITETEVSNVLFSALKNACDVYFRFIQRFLFEGEIDDRFNEFFIKKDPNYVNSCNKKYWDKGFVIGNNDIIPEFLKEIANYILLCGKSVRLLRLCVPDDPFCILLSSDHPQIKTCFTFSEIEEQEKCYDQYRKRCLYVCGEPVNFQSLRLQREIEKKNLKDLVQLKQTESLQKIIDEQKRLHLTLSVSKKQHFEEQRKAVLEAESEKRRQKERNLLEDQMYLEYNLAMEKVDQLKIKSEKKKVQDYYREIGEEIENRRKKAEWKIKRLKLDDRRTQMIIGEKMTLSIEKLEKDNEIKQENENLDNEDDKVKYQINIDNVEKMETSVSSLEMSPEVPVREIITNEESSVQYSAEVESSLPILNKANITDDSKISFDDSINKNSLIAAKEYKSLDFSISPSDIINSNDVYSLKTSSISEQNIHDTYVSRKLEALKNKQKVLNQEMGVNILDTNVNTGSETDDNKNIMMQNKIKSMQSNHFDSDSISTIDINRNERPQYNTDASREAMKNKTKVLGHEFGIDIASHSKIGVKPKDNLSLDLKKCFNNNPVINISPENGNLKYEMDLNLETPSNIEAHIMCLPTANTLSPTSAKVNNDKDNTNVTMDGFPFPSFIEDSESEDEVDNVDQPEDDSNENNQSKPNTWNFNSEYFHIENFKPFGIESTAKLEKLDFNIFNRSFLIEKKSSPYSDIREIIELSKKSPLTDVFEAFASIKDHDTLLKKIDNEDISTIITCLQRSIVIPLTYQMELANNAILKYFLVKCELYEHLKNLCDYFFLMNGEFAKTICLNLFEKLNCTESPKDLLNFATLHSILDKSFGSSVTGYNKYAENLSFIVNNMPLSFHHSSPDVLECLTLSYAVAWPINIILSPEAMERYGKVFQFLIKLRRISWSLDQNSESLKMSLKEEFMVSRDLLRSPQYHTIHLYRHTMSSLIRGLQTYIISTCLQGSWTEFENDLMTVETLDDLYSVHVVYIKKVLFRCLLNKRSSKVMKLLNDIFTVILRFHHLLNARCWHIAEDDIHYTHPLFSQMKELFVTYTKLTKHFHKTITCLSDCGYQPHLVELLTIIDYNGYYSSQKKLLYF